MLLPLLLLPFLALAKATTYTLNHRFTDSASGSGTGFGFTKYGTVDIPEDRDLNEVIRIDLSSVDNQGEGQGEGWYQVQLIGEGLGAGVLSSTKACYLNAGSVTLIIHTHPKGISSIDLIPHTSVPKDGSCPTGRPSGSAMNREVVIKTPHLVYGPDLSPPPPPSVSPDGKPIIPEVEKSFLQKYWLPLLGVGFFVISQMAPEEKKDAAK